MEDGNGKSENDSVDFWALRTGIRDEIQACIWPSLNVDELPPFTVPELFVMAILTSEKEALTFPELMKWIVTTFQYYKTMALDQYVECGTYDEGAAESPCNVVDGFAAAFACFEAPFYDPAGVSIVSYCNECLYPSVAGAHTPYTRTFQIHSHISRDPRRLLADY